MENKQEKKVFGVYAPAILNMKVILSINEVGNNVKQNLEKMIQKRTEGRCISEGFIKPGSVKVMTYSSGNILNANVEFQTVYECMICYPVEGMKMECVAKTITKAGVHAEVIDEDGTVPVTVFIARDHHFTQKNFSTIKEGDKLTVSVIGCRFELNDNYVSVIASLSR
jgi:DNA-directed RNA polymerase subunit E'/Rpb7